MADALEDFDSIDSDRVIDQQSFNCSQFEIFTHEYRERKEIHKCEDHTSTESSCTSLSSTDHYKKQIINTSRKLQKGILSLQRMSSSVTICEVADKMREIEASLKELLKQSEAEFSTTTVPLPPFDTADMQLFLGEAEVPDSRNPIEEVEQSEKLTRQKIDTLLFEADVMLRECEHLKSCFYPSVQL